MWISLTLFDGAKLIINLNMVEAIQPTDENGGKSILSSNRSSYTVKETVEEIEKLIHITTAISLVTVGGGKWK